MAKVGIFGALILFAVMGLLWIGMRDSSKKVVLPETIKRQEQYSDWDLNLSIDVDSRLKQKTKQKGVLVFSFRVIPALRESPLWSDHGRSAVSVSSFPVKFTVDLGKVLQQTNPNVSFSKGDVLYTAVLFCPDVADMAACAQTKSPNLVARFYVTHTGDSKSDANEILSLLDERRQNPRGPVFLSGKIDTKGIREKLPGFDGAVYLSFRRLKRTPGLLPLDGVYLLPVAWHKVNLGAEQDSFSIERAATLTPGHSESLLPRLLICPKEIAGDPLRCAYESSMPESAERLRAAYPDLPGKLGDYLEVQTSDLRLPTAGDANLQFAPYVPM